MRDRADDRFTITVEGVSHAEFFATAPTLDQAKATAHRVCRWVDHRGKRTIVTDRVPATRETKSIFGGARTVRENPVVWHVTAASAEMPAGRAA